MEPKFVLSCCSTVDLPYSYTEQRHIPVLFYHYVVGEQDYVDDMGRDPEALPRFYRLLEEGKLILAFLGSSFAFILYLYSLGLETRQLLSSAYVSMEVISGVASSVGVILSIPLTALIGAVAFTRKK